MKRGDVAVRGAMVVLAAVAIYLVVDRWTRGPTYLRTDVWTWRPHPLKVLFVGNSHTFVNDLPKTFGKLAAAGDPDQALEVKDVTLGGATLQQHLRLGVAERAIEGERWDWVVLQENSNSPTSAPDAFERAVIRFDTIIRAAHAKTAIYELWPWRIGQDPNALDAAYRRVAGEVHALVVPVGPAWLRAERADGKLELYEPDGYHPSRAGTYLAGCVFYATLLGRDPAGLPDLDMVAPAEAGTLQRAAAP